MLLLAGLISLALFRVSKQQQRHESLNQTFATVAALEHAQSDLALLLASANTLAQTSDPQTADAARQAVGGLEEHLGEAHAGALAQDDTGLLTDLDNLIAQIGVVSEITQQRLPDLIAADRSQSTESAAATVGELSRQAYAIHAGLDRLVREQQDDYAAAASAANHAVNVNLWLLMGIVVGAAAAVCATVAALLLPVLRPLASLQASVRAIASGDLGTRARVSGPEEVASLARDFNQMVDERQRADETLQQTATDLERSIEAQRESEERLGTIVANAPVILFAVNQDGVLTLSEGKGLEALGLKPGEAVGLSVFDMFPHVQGMAENIHHALEGEAFTRTEELAGLTFETHCAPLRDGNGQVSGLIGVAIDISERQRTEEALRESEEHLRTVVTNAPVILFVVNRDGVFTLCEGKGLAALGLKPEKVVGLSIFNVFRDRPEIKEKLHRALDSEAFTTTVEIDGVVFEAQCAPLRDRSGQIPGLIGVATDVTERKRMEEALRESEEKYRQIFESAQDIFFRTDLMGTIIEASPSAERYGYTREQLIGRSVLDLYENPEDRMAFLEMLLERGEAADYELRLKTGDGRIAHASACGRVLRDSSGAPTGFEGFLRDIGERKRMEEALRESEAKYRQIFENVQDIFYRTDLQGTILELSPSVERYGYSRNALIGTPAGELYENPERRSDLVQTLLERGEVTDYEIRLKTADGGAIDTSLSGHLLHSPDGTPIGLEGFLRDITERKQMDEALRESEEKFRRIFDNVYDIYYRTDAQGIITDISPSVRQFGYTPEELIGREVLDIYENPEERSALLEALFERGVVVDYEVHLKTGDGPARSTSVSTHLLRGPDGAFAGVEGSLRDISERKRIEEALRESEARYRRVFDNVQDLFYRTDASGIITDISPSVERYGYTREQLIGTQVLDVYEDPEERAALLKALAEKGVAIDHEVHLRTADGQVRDASVSAHLQRGPDGSPIGVEGSLRDISERKRMEKALRESEERYRSVVEASPDAIMLTDLGTRIIMANRQTALLFGFESVAEMLSTGKSTFDFIAPEDRERANVNARETLELRTLRDVEYTLIRKDGSRFSGEMTASLITDADGNPKAFIGVVRDITERKRVEEALREQVRRDPLTGTLNHAVIVEELRSLISNGAEGAPHAVAMIDVNDLKIVNDTFGHQVGDEVLITVADALAGDGVLVGRYGGDEFVTILPNADREAAEGYRQDVLASLEDVDLRDPDTRARVPVAVSVGFAIYPAEAERIEDLIKLADSAMYAWRRQRPVLSTVRSSSRSLGSDRAAKMVGEIVPLLTSSGDLNDKLRLVAHRLSVGAGYDGVNFALIRPGLEEPLSLNTFAEMPEQAIEAWNREQHENGWDSKAMRVLAERGRPIIMDDLQRDQRLTDKQRELLCAAGMQSAVVAPMLWRNELVGVLSVASKREAAFGPRDAQFLMAVAAQVTGIVRMATLVGELQSTSTRLAQAQTETVMMLAAAAEAHDQATGLHLQNVRAITETLACELGYRQEDAEELGLAAVLHDIGKIRVPDVVLSTAGQLTDPEWDLMKQHTVWGGGFLAGRQGFELAATIARSHHERWDGSGYPNGLAGEDIPKAATIVAVADAFDAMTSDRPYRAARSVAAAVREIVACSGSHFNPKVVQALVRLHKRKILRLRRQTLGKLAA
jgi:diguanylate cyclase (GGDEF)-like protein/PAS domain S-box-containing protein